MNNDGALPGRDTLARRIASGLGRLALAIKAKAWRGASDEGITPTQGELLARLLDQPEGLRLGDLAVALGISAPTASDAVTTLVAKDLVERRAGTDKRSVTLRLTRSGRKMALKANDWTAFLAGSIESLPELEQAAFITSLIKIIRTMQDAGDISPQRMCVTCAHFRPFMHRGTDKPHHCAFVDAAFGPPDLQLNCPDHDMISRDRGAIIWRQFSSAADLVEEPDL